MNESTTKEHMQLKELEAAVISAQAVLSAVQGTLDNFKQMAENNVFATLGEARATLEHTLLSRAHEDCEGSYNCGSDSYTQEFIVDGMLYVAVLDVQYNRHDKTYYYIDDSEFKIEEVGSH